MKKLITIILFIFISNLSFSQIKRAGDFYELDKLWKRDSVSVKQLINKFNLDISKLETFRFFKDFELNKELHDNYSYTSYVYILDKDTGVVTMNSYIHEGIKPKLNKYVMIVCFDADSGKKTITIKVF
jgi:hypothetical protein